MHNSLRKSRAFSHRWLATAAVGGTLFVFRTQHARADVNDIADIFLIKAQENRQTSTTDPVSITNSFSFQVGANPTSLDSILSAAFQSPTGPIQNMGATGGGNFYFFGGAFATLANLNTAFPNGAYNFTFQTVTPPTLYTPTVLLTGDSYPAVPKIVSTAWAANALEIDVTADFTFTFNSFSPLNSDSVVMFQINDAAGATVFSRLLTEGVPPPTSILLPANTLLAGQFYDAKLVFENRTVTHPGQNTVTIASYQVQTGFKIAAISGMPVIISPLSVVATVGRPFVYQFIATNHPNDYIASNLPPGLTLDATLGIIRGIPTAVGNSQASVGVGNSIGYDGETLITTVQSAPPGPFIVSSTCALGSTGRTFVFRVATQGATSAARVSQTNLPNGLNLDASTGVISGTTDFIGSTIVNLTVTDGNFTTTGSLQLTFTADPGFPVITNANTVSVPRGRPFSYTIATSGASDPTDPPVFATPFGALPQGLSFNPATGTISGTYSGPLLESAHGEPRKPEQTGGILLGSIQLFGTNSHGTSTFQLLFLAAPSAVVNISTRLLIGTGEDVLIGGFIITAYPGNADAQKVVIVRAIGPSLNPYLTGALQDPTLELHDSANHVVYNDNWRTDPIQQQLIMDSGIPPGDDRESAIVAALDPGQYTAKLAGKNGATGIALVEIYDLGTTSLDPNNLRTELAQISTRGNVLADNNVMIGGFIVDAVTTRILARAIGPSLSAFGITNALQDTTLELHDGNGAIIAMNDNWRSDQEQIIIATGAPPTDDRESALVANLVPGAYTAIVRGQANTTGVALVEVYKLP